MVGNKGQVFSVDFVVAVIIVIIFFGLVVNSFEIRSYNTREEISRTALSQKADAGFVALTNGAYSCEVEVNSTHSIPLAYSLDLNKIDGPAPSGIKNYLGLSDKKMSLKINESILATLDSCGIWNNTDSGRTHIFFENSENIIDEIVGVGSNEEFKVIIHHPELEEEEFIIVNAQLVEGTLFCSQDEAEFILDRLIGISNYTSSFSILRNTGSISFSEIDDEENVVYIEREIFVCDGPVEYEDFRSCFTGGACDYSKASVVLGVGE